MNCHLSHSYLPLLSLELACLCVFLYDEWKPVGHDNHGGSGVHNHLVQHLFTAIYVHQLFSFVVFLASAALFPVLSLLPLSLK